MYPAGELAVLRQLLFFFSNIFSLIDFSAPMRTKAFKFFIHLHWFEEYIV